MVVQQDPIPGLTQDWLVRPIRRRDLLLSKVLFVALMVQGPILLTEVCQCLAAGFPLGPSLAAPLSRSVWMLLAMDLPVLAFATLTRSLAHAAGAAIAIVVGFAIFTQATILYTNSLFNSMWVTDAAQIAWGVADRFHAFQIASAHEHGQAAEKLLLGGAQQIVAPIHGGAQCLLALRQVSRSAG